MFSLKTPFSHAGALSKRNVVKLCMPCCMLGAGFPVVSGENGFGEVSELVVLFCGKVYSNKQMQHVLIGAFHCVLVSKLIVE